MVDTINLMLQDETKINIGDVVYGDENSFNVPVGDDFIGRVVNAFALPVDGRFAAKSLFWL